MHQPVIVSGQDVWTRFLGFNSSYTNDFTRTICSASCYKTSCSGWSNRVLFTPEYPENHGFSSESSYYYATCEGTWTADMRDSGWGSTCSTDWEDILIVD